MVVARPVKHRARWYLYLVAWVSVGTSTWEFTGTRLFQGYTTSGLRQKEPLRPWSLVRSLSPILARPWHGSSSRTSLNMPPFRTRAAYLLIPTLSVLATLAIFGTCPFQLGTPIITPPEVSSAHPGQISATRNALIIGTSSRVPNHQLRPGSHPNLHVSGIPIFLLTAAICAGAKQGIGLNLAKRLKEKGWNVFASVRSLADVKNNEVPRLSLLTLESR